MGPPLTAADLERLRRYDTPTICNALEVLVPERRGLGFTMEPLVCSNASAGPMVGYARTATIRAAQPSALSGDEQRKQRLDYYRYVADGYGPTIAIIQDLDPQPGFGAFWGEVNTNVHQGLGCLGAVTNGSIRDLDDLADGFQLLGGKVGPSHAFVHVVDFGGQVNVFGMTVRHCELIHADRHGAVAIPIGIATELPKAVDLVARREKVILDASREPGFDIGALERAMAGAAEIH